MWLTTQKCLTGSFDTIWQLQNIITSNGESVNSECQLHSACQISAALTVSPPCLISSPTMSLHSLPCQSSSPVRNRLILIHFVQQQQVTKVSSHGVRAGCIRARAGVQRVIYVRGHNNCIPMRYRTNIYRFIIALAQIRPPHCTISCLASRSAICLTW